MPADPNRVQAVFLAAVELPGPARAEFLDRVCGTDAALRERVDRLLAAHRDDSDLGPSAGAFVHDAAGTVDLPSGTPPTGTFNPEAPRSTSLATGADFPDGPTGTVDGAPTRRERPGATELGAVIAGRYRLIEVIGEGGMGTVFLASQIEPVKRQLALKLIRAGMDSKAVLARFDAERQALALMDHPNIARIYDGGVTPLGRPYFVMELVKGVPLAAYCDARRLSVGSRLELFVSVCQAVQHAHQKGIIHRDLKPGNVLVTEVDGRPTPKVIDFGVAKATEQRLTDLSLAGTTALVGTPLYMSPEQTDPGSMDIDTRTDVYALGVMLYELLVGSTPINSQQLKRGAILEVLRMVREVDPPRPSAKLSAADDLPNIAANRSTEPVRLARALRGELDWVVMKALEKDRSRRYDTANGLARDIQRYLADEVVEARSPSTGYRLKKFVRRHKVQVIAASVVLLALVTGVIGTTAGLIEARQQADAKEDQRRVAEAKGRDATIAWGHEADARVRAEAATVAASEARAAEAKERANAEQERDELNGQLYLARISQAQLAYEAGDRGRLRTVLNQFRPRAGRTDRRGWEWFYLAAQIRGEMPVVRAHSGTALVVAFAPGGRRLASADGAGRVKVWEVESGRELAAFPGPPKGISALAWSPQGDRLALVGDEAVRICDPTGRKLIGLPASAPAGRSGATPIWSPDGKSLATGDRDGAVRVWDVISGREKLVLRSGQVQALAWSPNGKQLASFGDGIVKLWDASTGSQAFTFWGPQHLSPLRSEPARCDLAWTRDGKRLGVALAVENGIIRSWDAATGNLTFSLSLLPKQPPRWHLFESKHSRLVWSPDGARLASVTGPEEPIQIWDAVSGRDLFSLGSLQGTQSGREPSPDAINLVWSADGRRLARSTSDGTIWAWEPAIAANVRTTLTLPTVVAPTWGDDGREIFGAGWDGSIRVWDAATAEMIRTVGTDSSPLCATAWSHDGRRLATANRAGAIEIRDASTGERLLALAGYTGPVTALEWSPDDRKLTASGADRSVRVWDLSAGKQLLYRAPSARASDAPLLVWSREGRWLMIGYPWSGVPDDGSTEVWDTVTGRATLTFDRTVGVRSALWGPTGGLVAALDGAGTVRVREPESGRQVVSFKTTAGSFAWGADGKRLVAFSVTEGVKIWDAATGDELFKEALIGPNKFPQGSSGLWSPDGRYLALMDSRGEIRIWDSTQQKEHSLFNAVAGTQLSAVWSVNSNRLASTSTDASGKTTVQVWNLNNGKESFRLDGLQQHPTLTSANWLSWSPAGDRLAGALVDGTVTVWDGATGKAIFRLDRLDSLPNLLDERGQPIAAGVDPKLRAKKLGDWLIWSPNGPKLAVLEAEGTVSVRSTDTGAVVLTLAPIERPVQRRGPPDTITTLAVSPDGRSIAAGQLGAVKIWESNNGYVTRVLEDAPSPIRSFAWSPDGSRLVRRRWDNKVQVCDTAGKELFATQTGGTDAEGGAERWSPDGRYLAASSSSGLRVWDTQTWAVIFDVRAPWGKQQNLLRWSPDGKALAAVGKPSISNSERVEEIKIWEIPTGRERVTIRSAARVPGTGTITLLDWSRGGRWLAASRSDGLIKVWDTATGKEILDLPSIRTPRSRGPNSGPRFAWNPDGQRLATETEKGTIRVYDVVAPKGALTLGDEGGQIGSFAWNPAGTALAWGQWGFNQAPAEQKAEVKVWDATTGKFIFSRALDKCLVTAVGWSPDSARLAVSSVDRGSLPKAHVRVWDVGADKEVAHTDSDAFGPQGHLLSWAPLGPRLALAADGKIQVWDVPTGKKVLSWEAPVAAWHPDGKRLAVPGADATLKIWDASTGSETLSLGRPRGIVSQHDGAPITTLLAWSADAKRLATSASNERTIKIWDVATGKALVTCAKQDTLLRNLVWDRDGTRVASAGEDASVKIWNAVTGDLISSFEDVRSTAPSTNPHDPQQRCCLVWRPDGRQLMVTGEDNVLRAWDTGTGEKITYYGHTARVCSVAWNPDGTRLASLGTDGFIKLWDTASGQEVFGLRAPSAAPLTGRVVKTLAWNSTGGRLALFSWSDGGGADTLGTVTLWDGHLGAE